MRLSQEVDKYLDQGFDLGEAIAAAILVTEGRACGHHYDCDCVTIREEMSLT